MRIPNTLSLNERKSLDEQVRDLQVAMRNVIIWSQGRVAFGTGVDGERGQNMEGEFQQFTSSATPNAENTVAHGLNSIPIGYIILWQDKAGSLYGSPTNGTDWTTTNFYVKCDVASVEFLIFLVKKGQTDV